MLPLKLWAQLQYGSTTLTLTLPSIFAEIIHSNKKNSFAHHCKYPYAIQKCSMQPRHFKSSNEIILVTCKQSLLANMEIPYLCTFLTVPFRKKTFLPVQPAPGDDVNLLLGIVRCTCKYEELRHRVVVRQACTPLSPLKKPEFLDVGEAILNDDTFLGNNNEYPGTR